MTQMCCLYIDPVATSNTVICMKNIEAVVAKVNDLQDGEKKQISVGDTDVLLARVDGKFHALGAYCTHYKAPLAEGVLSGDRLVCPWHNACFDVVTGDQQEPPGLDSISRYEVRVEGDNVFVSVPEKTSGRRTLPMAQYNPGVDGRTFVVLGAGAAGSAAVEVLRQDGFQGRIVMATGDSQLPYDRTWLSKDYFVGKVSREQMPLRSSEFYQDHSIEVLTDKQAARIDAQAKTVTFTDGDSLHYDALLIATGGKPRDLQIEGADLQNVFTLRSFSDSDRILAAAQSASQAVVVGSSFIGMEIASGLTQLGLQVTIVAPDSVPFKKILGAEVGRVFQEVHEEQGVSFRLSRKTAKIAGRNGKVEAVVLDNGERLSADLVVVGIGVQPATGFLQLKLNPEDGSVPVDEYLRVSEGVYAAGDIASFPDWRTGEYTRIEHWRLAAQHGRIAAHNMVGQAVKFAGVPIFWTMQFKFPLRYVGHAEEWEEIIFDGDPQKREFIAFYVKGDKVLAVAASQRDTQMAAVSELMRLDKMPTPVELRDGAVDLVRLVQQ